MQLFFSNLNIFLNFILKKDLLQILLENESFEKRAVSTYLQSDVKILLEDKASLDRVRMIMAFYRDFGVQFKDLLVSYSEESRKDAQSALSPDQQVKLRHFEHKIDNIKDDLTLKYLFQDIYIPRTIFNRFVGNPVAEKNSTFGFLMPLKSLTIFEKTPIELYNDFYDYNSLTDFYKSELKRKVSLNNFGCEVLEMSDIACKLNDLRDAYLLSQKDFVFVVSQLSDSILFTLDEINLLILNFERLQEAKDFSQKMAEKVRIKCVEFVSKLCSVRSVYQNYLLVLTSMLKRYSEDKKFSGDLYNTISVLRNLVRFYEETVIPTFVVDQYIARSVYSGSSAVLLKNFAKEKRSGVEDGDLNWDFHFGVLFQLPTFWSSSKKSITLLVDKLQQGDLLSSNNTNQMEFF